MHLPLPVVAKTVATVTTSSTDASTGSTTAIATGSAEASIIIRTHKRCCCSVASIASIGSIAAGSYDGAFAEDVERGTAGYQNACTTAGGSLAVSTCCCERHAGGDVDVDGALDGKSAAAGSVVAKVRFSVM